MSSEANAERIRSIEQRLDKYEVTQKEIKDVLSEIRGELSRYKGFIGGVLFVFSAIGAAITLFLKVKSG